MYEKPINGEIVTINLEAYPGEKSVRIYKTSPANAQMGDADFECEKRTAEEVK